MYPVMLCIRGRRCLVVGGGGIALRKVLGLVGEGAAVTVVAPRVVAQIEELAAAGRITLELRPYRPGEAAGYNLVFAATDDRQVNGRVYDDGDAAGVWVNVADDVEYCSFHLPARIHRGPLELAVASGGGAPFVVRRLRQMFEGLMGAEWGEWMDAAARFRDQVRFSGADIAAQEAAFDRFFAATVDRERLAVRVPSPDEMARWAPAADPVAAPEPEHAAAPGGDGAPRGHVALVGAGPGAAGLLTLRGYRRLLAADAVVYDRLAAPAMPADLPAHVELHCVGKTAGYHPVPQEQINELLVRLGLEGKRVVRLKGGDPYVFGRGGEEVDALREAGVPFEVVPGVTSGIAAPAWAGIPVTHRREAVRLTLVTAHECSKADGPQVRWDLLAQDRNATIVGYMGVTSLASAVHELMGGGMSPDMPAAVIERGTTSAQRSVVSRLDDIVAAVEREGLKPPAIFLIGPTARHAKELDWFSGLPLCRERIAVPAGERDLADALERAGADVLLVSYPVSPAARIAMSALPLTGCVLRSADDVDGLEDERATWAAGHGPRRVVAWCLSDAAAARARELGWACVERIGEGSARDRIAGEIAERLLQQA